MRQPPGDKVVGFRCWPDNAVQRFGQLVARWSLRGWMKFYVPGKRMYGRVYTPRIGLIRSGFRRFRPHPGAQDMLDEVSNTSARAQQEEK